MLSQASSGRHCHGAIRQAAWNTRALGGPGESGGGRTEGRYLSDIHRPGLRRAGRERPAVKFHVSEPVRKALVRQDAAAGQDMSDAGESLRGGRVLLTATAWHEAGHALAALREGFHIRQVSIDKRRPGHGVTWCQLSTPLARYNPETGRGSAQAAWQDAVDHHLSHLRVKLAGPLAEARKLGKPMRALGGWSDFEDTYWLAQDLMGIQTYLERYKIFFWGNVPALFNDESRRLRHWLARPATWSIINAIAAELLEKDALDGADILRCALTTRSGHQLPLNLGWTEESAAEPSDEALRHAA